MADLTDIQASLSVKLSGAGPTSGVDTYYAQVDSSGSLQVAGEGTAGTPSGGVMSVQGVAGGTALSVSQSSTPWLTQDAADGPVSPGTAATKSILMGGQYNSVLPTLTNTQQSAVQLDSSGRILIGSIANALPAGANNIGSVNQGTSPWVVSGTVAATQSGTWTVQQGTPPWTIQGDSASGAAKAGNPVQTGAVFNTTQPTVTTGQTVENQATARGALIVATGVDAFAVNASQTGTWTVQPGNTANTTPWLVTIATALPAGSNNIGSVNQGTSPWITKDQSDGPVAPGAVASFSQLSGGQYNSTPPTLTTGQQVALQVDSAGRLLVDAAITNTNDTNYGTVGSNTLRTAAQIGNATGAADFAAGNSSAQTLRVVVASNQVAIPVSQSGAWTVAVTQSTSPWVTSDLADGPVTPGTVATKSILTGGQYNSTLPTLTNTQQSALQLDSSGRILVGSIANALPAGSNTIGTVNQGTANTLANAWSQKITDGTNGPVAVKPASTVPLSTDPALVVTLSPNSSPLNAATGSGTISALNGTVAAPGGSAVTWSLSGTWVGTVITQAQNGDGQWWNVASLSNQSGLIANGTSINGVLEMNAAGWTQIRLLATAWTSGTVTVTWNVTTGMHVIIPYSLNGANFNTYTTLTDSSQNPLGTTAASTAATAAQEALVVALSPNSPLPAGTNLLGSINQGTSPWITKDQSDGPVTPGTVASFSQLMGGQYNSTLPTVTNTQQVAIQTDSNGRVLISPNTQLPVVGTGSNGSPNGGVLSIQGVPGGTAVPVSGTLTNNNAAPAANNVGALIALAEGTLNASRYTTGDQVLLVTDLAGNTNVDLQYISGTAAVTAGVSGLLAVGGNVAAGSAVAGNPVRIGGSDGTNVRDISLNLKGTQGAYGVAVQNLKDAGRNQTNYFMAAQIVSTATETLQSLTGYKGGVAVTATTTPVVVTTGKTYRVQKIVITYIAITTAGTIQVNLRANLTGVVAIGSPLVDSWNVGAAAATAGTSETVTIMIPDGLEFAAGTGIGITVQGFGATGTAAAVGYAKVSISGYEY